MVLVVSPHNHPTLIHQIEARPFSRLRQMFREMFLGIGHAVHELPHDRVA